MSTSARRSPRRKSSRPAGTTGTPRKRTRTPAAAAPSAAPTTAATFAPPVRVAPVADRILVVIDESQRDPLLDQYLAIMTRHGHPCDVLSVPPNEPTVARRRIREHPGIREGAIRGIQLFGKSIPSFRILKFDPAEPTRISRGATDLPFGSDFAGYDVPLTRDEITNSEGIQVNEFAAALSQPDAAFRQDQWVARIFRLDEAYLENLATTEPPQVNNMLIVNADPVFDDAELNDRIRTRYRNRYGTLTAGQNRRFAFLDIDFQKGELFAFLEENLPNATFLSIADHGNSNKIANLPPSQNGIPTLPRLPDMVEFASCSACDWMAEEDPSISVVEATLRQGCLTAVGAQCLLAWNLARGYPDPNPGTNPYEQDNQNAAPMLDVWPTCPSLGHAQIEAVTQAFKLFPTSVYIDKPHLAFQILSGHSLFGDGTLAFANQSFA